MPFIEPTKGDVHVNKPLTNISPAMWQVQDKFIAGRAFPEVPVPKKSDVYFDIPRGEFNRDEMQQRAPGTESAGGVYTVDNTPNYLCKVYAFHKDIDDQTAANYDSPLDASREATEFVTHKALIQREVKWATDFFGTGKWTTDITGVSGAPGASQFQQWNEAASTPIEDVRFGCTAVEESTGFRPNRMVLQRHVWDALLDHPDIVGRIDRGQTQGTALVARQTIAALFELDEILVMAAIKNTSPKGSTAVHTFVGGKAALLIYTPPRAGIYTPSAGYTFTWTGYLGATRNGNRMKRFRMEHLESDRHEIQSAYDQKKVAADLGYFFATAVA